MDSAIEVQRQTHEEIERFERALATVLSKPHSTQHAKLANEHKAAQILDRITSRVHTLYNTYQDEQARKAEIDAITGPKPDDFMEFYARVGKIKDFHTKYPNQVVGGFQVELAALVDNDVDEEDEEDEQRDRKLFMTGAETLFNKYYSHCITVLWGRGVWTLHGSLCAPYSVHKPEEREQAGNISTVSRYLSCCRAWLITSRNFKRNSILKRL